MTPSELAAKIGERVRDLRLQKNLSQAKLAKLSGVSTTALRVIERGKSNPLVETLVKLAEALGVDAIDVFNVGDDERSAIMEATRGMSEAEVREALALAQALDDGPPPSCTRAIEASAAS